MYWLWWRNVLRMLIVNCSFITVNMLCIVVSYFRSPPCPWSSTCTQKYPGPVRVRPDTQTATDQYFQSSLASFTDGVNSALSLSFSLGDLIKIGHNERWWRTRSGKLCTVTDWSPVLSWNTELVLRLLSTQRQGSLNQVHPADREPTTFSTSLFYDESGECVACQEDVEAWEEADHVLRLQPGQGGPPASLQAPETITDSSVRPSLQTDS